MGLDTSIRVVRLPRIVRALVLCASLVLVISIARHTPELLYPAETELFAGRMLHLYDGIGHAPEWQRTLFAPNYKQEIQKEILAAYRETETDDQTLFQLAVIQLHFGIPASETLSAIESQSYQPLIRLMQSETSLDGTELEKARIAVATSETWWSYHLRERFPELGLPLGDTPTRRETAMWNRALLFQSCMYALLASAIALLILFRAHRSVVRPNKYFLLLGTARMACVWWAFLSAVVLYVLVGVSGYLAWNAISGMEGALVESCLETVSRMLPAVFLAACVCRSWRFHARAWGLRKVPWKPLIWWTSAGILLAMLADYALQLFSSVTSYSGLRDVLDPALLSPEVSVLMGQIWVASVIAPLSEEIVFRGILYPVLRGRVGVWPAILIQATVFASIHLYSWIGALSVFIAGIIFCWLFEKTKSLWSPLLLHSIYNFISTVFVWLYFGKSL